MSVCDVVWQKAAMVWVDFQPTLERWHRALVAIAALADAAGDADRFKATFEIQPVGIDQAGGVSDFAAEADGVAAHRGEERAAGF